MDTSNQIERSTKNFDKKLIVLLGYSLGQDYSDSLARGPKNYSNLREGLLFQDIDLVIRPKEMRASMGPVYAMGQSHMIIADKLNPEVHTKDFEDVFNEYLKWKNYRIESSSNPIHKKD